MRRTEAAAQPRKRSRMSDDADDTAVAAGGKKARGRPRVDTQDATAADVSIIPYPHSAAPISRPLPIESIASDLSKKHVPQTDSSPASKDTNSSCTTRISAAQRDDNHLTKTAELSITCDN